MENKKPQNTPAPTKTPTKAVAAKPKPSAHATVEKPKPAPQTKGNTPAPAKPAQTKQSTAQKPQSAATAKAAQPTQKKPNVEVKAKAVKQPSPAKPQAPIAKAPVTKVADIKPTTERKLAPAPKAVPEAKPASAPKAVPEAKPAPAPKAVPEAKPASAPKVVSEAKPASAPKVVSEAKPALAPKVKPKVKEQTRVPEAKADDKSAPATISASKPSKFVDLATKGFVIQSWQIAVAVAIVAVLVVGGVLLGTLLGNKDIDDPIVDYTGPLVNQNPDDPSSIALPGYSALVFSANSKKVTLELPNPSGNPCYFQYALTVVETGEEIYRSELLEPGKTVKDLTLNKALPAGTYTLRITIDTFSLLDGTTPMNGGVQEVELTVK